MGLYPKLPDRKIPLWRRILARLGFPTILYWDKEHFKAPTPIYVAWCKYHGVYYLDYPRYSGYLLCPLCNELYKKIVEAEKVEAVCQL